MSLINDALRDLESRKASNKDASSVDTDDLTQSPNASWRSIILFTAFIFALGFFASTLFLSDSGLSTVHQLAHEEANVTQGTVVSRVAPIVENTHDTNQIHPAEDKAEKFKERVELQETSIDEHAHMLALLNDADAALASDRLSVAQESSALALYKKVLAIDTKNTRALEGIKRVKRRYLVLVEEAVKANAPDLAHTYHSRLGALIDANDPEEINLSYDSLRDVIARARVKNVIPESRSSIKKSDSQTRRDLMAEVENSIEQGDFHSALLVLEGLRQSEADFNHAASIKLFDLYFRMNKNTQAQQLLDERESRGEFFPHQRAKLLQRVSGDETAFQYLRAQEALPHDAMAMLAAFYQQRRSYAEAYNLYETLVQSEERNSIYWLGFAVSADGLEKSTEAYRAYLVSKTLGGHSAAVDQFIARRIDVLGKTVEKSVELTQW